MIRIQNFNFIIGKFLQMPKLPYNVLKISGGANAPNASPWLRACCSLLTRRTVCGRAAGNTFRTKNKPEIVQAQSWRYKTIVVIQRQQQITISRKKRTKEQKTRLQCLAGAIPKSVMPSGAVKSAKLLRR